MLLAIISFGDNQIHSDHNEEAGLVHICFVVLLMHLAQFGSPTGPVLKMMLSSLILGLPMFFRPELFPEVALALRCPDSPNSG